MQPVEILRGAGIGGERLWISPGSLVIAVTVV